MCSHHLTGLLCDDYELAPPFSRLIVEHSKGTKIKYSRIWVRSTEMLSLDYSAYFSGLVIWGTYY
jgi:hypothetical protein